jgi:4-hydroxyphenylacetate 3-monooxygenase
MSAINGKQYVERINQLKANVWVDGKLVTGDISEHPAFKGAINSQAKLYDLQHDKKIKDIMTYQSPASKKFVGTSYLQPKTKEELKKRREMTQQWAQLTHGMMGRSPDYMNTVLMAFASSAELLRGTENCFPENIISYYEYVREHDLSLTHTFIDPQVNRIQFYYEQNDEPIAAKIVDKNNEGIVIQGAKLLATQGGMTDELLVLSSGGIQGKEKGFAFSIPSNTKGIKFICRESFAGKDSTFDYPLSSRFEEMDTIVVFDHVLVPWNRVFFYENVDVSNTFLSSSYFSAFALHQVSSRRIVKTEFVLGIVQSLIETINITDYPHVREKATELIIALETMKALVMKAEEEAEIDPWGYMRPNETTLRIAANIFSKTYPTFTEIIQLLGASGLMAIPTENTCRSLVKEDITRYLQAKSRGAEDRIKLFRLAWDLTMSPFGTRETLYERFFFGEPVQLTSYLYLSYDKERYVQRVTDFLKS